MVIFSPLRIFILKNREAMDEGAKVGWEQRFNHDEISALQHAMNLKFQDESAFAAEYQNEPLMDNIGDESTLSCDEIVQKAQRYKERHNTAGVHQGNYVC